MLTIVSMYRGHDAETFCQVVDCEMTDEQKAAWRKAHNCDEHYEGDTKAQDNEQDNETDKEPVGRRDPDTARLQ